MSEPKISTSSPQPTKESFVVSEYMHLAYSLVAAWGLFYEFSSTSEAIELIALAREHLKNDVLFQHLYEEVKMREMWDAKDYEDWRVRGERLRAKRDRAEKIPEDQH